MYSKNSFYDEVLRYLMAREGQKFRVCELAEALGEDQMVVWTALHALYQSDKIRRFEPHPARKVKVSEPRIYWFGKTQTDRAFDNVVWTMKTSAKFRRFAPVKVGNVRFW